MSQKPSKSPAGGKRGRGMLSKDVREHTEEKAGCQGAGEGTEDWKEKEKQQYLGGLRRLRKRDRHLYGRPGLRSAGMGKAV